MLRMRLSRRRMRRAIRTDDKKFPRCLPSLSRECRNQGGVASSRASPRHRTQRDGQGLPAGNGPGTRAGLRGVGAGEQPAQLDRGRELAALLVDGADRWVCAARAASAPCLGWVAEEAVGRPAGGSRKRAGDQGDRCCNRAHTVTARQVTLAPAVRCVDIPRKGREGHRKCPAHSEAIHRGGSAGSSFFPQDLPPGGSNPRGN
jgi:hypothetical protein